MQCFRAELMLLGFILHISGLLGKERQICALKGSSVNLTCFGESSAPSVNWYNVKRNNSTLDLKQLFANDNHKITEDGTLIIRDVQKTDDYCYCCQESGRFPEQCWETRTELHVADLQVKVLPATEGQKVTLICSTSCPLTESPSAFIWYKNGEFLYEDWSHWYQELVSNDPTVRYSCAIKGYEELRSSDVSVDFISPDCFGVTYSKVDVCPKKLGAADEPCSVIYPREVNIEMVSEENFVTLTCRTSCPAADSHTAFRWYSDKKVFLDCTSKSIVVFQSFDYISCAVNNNEHLHSDEICNGTSCRTNNYDSQMFCMLKGSSVSFSSKYSNPFQLGSRVWHKFKRSRTEDNVSLVEAGSRVVYNGVLGVNRHTLRISSLRKNDSGEYITSHFMDEGFQQPDLLGVFLVVTDLKVTMIPSNVVTEGQRVTLTCSTSCPLPENTTYTWFFNEQPLSLIGKQTKHVFLKPVRSWHAGNYSCGTRTPQSINSTVETLTVKRDDSMVTMNIFKIVFLSLFPLVGCTLYLLMRTTGKLSENQETKEVTTHYVGLPHTATNPSEGDQDEQQEDIV